jgi:hypothetical protein
MTLVSKLSLAALLAAAGTPATSLAHDHDRGRTDAPVQLPSPVPYASRDRDRDGRDDRLERDRWRDPRWSDRDGPFRHDARRRVELRQLREELLALDAERDRFYASGWHRPREVRRFERWYTFRRAELERRWDALQAYAWR